MRAKRVDLLYASVIALVSALCVAIFLAPSGVQESLRARSDEWSLMAFYSSTFVHVNLEHLALNLASFILLSVLLYALNMRTDRERRLLASLVSAMLLLPLVSNASFSLLASLLSERVMISCGLSVINSYLTGLIVPTFCILLEKPLRDRRGLRAFYTSQLFLTGSAMMYPYAGLTFYALAALVSTLPLGLIEILKPLWRIISYARQNPGAMRSVAYYAVILLCYYCILTLLFPARIASPGGYVVNIAAHAIGVFYGITTGAYTLNMLPKIKPLSGK